jgi:hypothetical protein
MAQLKLKSQTDSLSVSVVNNTNNLESRIGALETVK